MASSYKRVTWKESSKNPFGSYIKYKSNAYALCMSQCRKIKKGSSKNIAKPNQTQISLVWKGLNSKQWINSQTQNFSDIAIWGYFLKSSKIPLWWCSLNAFVIIIVFVFVFLILLVMVMFSHHSDHISQRSKVSKVALWRCSLWVLVFVIVTVFVFVFVVDIGYYGRGCVTPELRVWKRKIIRSDDRQTDERTNRISTCRLDPCIGVE